MMRHLLACSLLIVFLLSKTLRLSSRCTVTPKRWWTRHLAAINIKQTVTLWFTWLYCGAEGRTPTGKSPRRQKRGRRMDEVGWGGRVKGRCRVERWNVRQINCRKKHWKWHFKVATDESGDEDENLPSLFSAAENTDKMAAAMLSATLSQSVWLLLLVHL